MISKVLIIDDDLNSKEIKDLIERLNVSNNFFVKATSEYFQDDVKVDVLEDGEEVFTTNEDANKNLRNIILDADLLIIDWNLTGTDEIGDISRSVIINLLSKKIIPVIVYTSQIGEQVPKYLESLPKDILMKCKIEVVYKGDINKAIVEIDHYINNPGNAILKISKLWKPAVVKALDKTLFTISSQFNDEAINVVLRQIGLDNEKIPNALKDLLAEMLLSEIEPIETDLGNVNQLSVADFERGYPFYKKMQMLRMFQPVLDEKVAFTGDIFQMEDKNVYGIVISPRCDLIRTDDNSKVKFMIGFDIRTNVNWAIKHDVVNGAKGKKIPNEKEKMGSIIKKQLNGDQVDNLHWIYNVPINGNDEETIIFDYEFVVTKRISEIKNITRITRLREPYISDLIQNFTRHLLRPGVPSKPANSSAEKAAYAEQLIIEHLIRYGLINDDKTAIEVKQA